jgi:tRNA(fMet)-specific endonuclease VapC
MLDTNICSFIIREKPEFIKDRLISVEKEHTTALSSIVVSELLYGAKKRANKKLTQIIKQFIDNFIIYDFDKNASKYYADIRTSLEKNGNIIGCNDLFIASHAKSLDAILVTNNTKEFKRVSWLKIEDWSKEDEF